MLSFDLSLTRLALRRGAFAPGQMTSLALWHDPSDVSTLFQDTAMTIPVTSDGQAVAAMADKSGNGRHAVQATAAARPLYRNVSGVKWLQFDGVDDWMYVPSFNLSATNAVTLVGAIRNGGTNTASLVELSASPDAGNPDTFRVIVPNTPVSSLNYVAMTGTSGTFAMSIGSTPYTSGYVLSARLDRSKTSAAEAIKLRMNGGGTSSVYANNAVLPANFGSHPLYIGMRGGTSLPFTGRLYGQAILSRVLDDTEVARLESWMQGKIG